jgi:TonB family protein
MKIYALLFIVFSTSALFAQSIDTIYYDQYRKATNAPDYEFYRTITHTDTCLIVKDYYRTGQLRMNGTYTSLVPKEIKEGHFLYYSVAGIVTRDEYYKENLREGEFMSFDTSGHYTYKMHYKNDKLEDTLTGYYENGKIRRLEIYIHDTLVSGHCYDPDGNRVKFFQRQVMPEYPGGESAMMRFVMDHVRYPDKERENDIQGRVVVGFVVDERGSINDITIKKGVSHGKDKEALRVVKLFPDFSPGMMEDKPVKVAFVLPIMFKLASR